MAMRKEVSAIQIFSWGLKEGPVPCYWFSQAVVAFVLEEARLCFYHQIRQSSIGLYAPTLYQTLWIQISAPSLTCGFEQLTSALSTSVSPPIECGW